MKKLVVTAKLLALASLLAGLSSCAMNIAADSTSRVEGLQKTTACAYWLFFDLTGSVSDEELESWSKIAHEEVLAKLKSGDRLMIFGLHDNTAESGPLFSGSIPLLEDGAGYSAVVRHRQAVREFQSRAGAAISNVLLVDRRKASTTSILGAIDLFKGDAQRESRLVFFSDMLESEQACANLEKRRLEGQDLERLVRRLVSKRGYGPNVLWNAEVFCVVASTSIGERKPLNSRKVLREFWKSLFSAVGGRLISFDPYFSVPLVARETGGHGLSSSSSFAGR